MTLIILLGALVVVLVVVNYYSTTKKRGSARGPTPTPSTAAARNVPGDGTSTFHWPGDGEYEQEVAGESFYQDALSRICGGKCEEGHNKEVIAQLVREPENEFDRNAVAVIVQGQKVGHLPRDFAASWSAWLRKTGREQVEFTCDGLITGGWKRKRRSGFDEGHFGIWLDIFDEDET